MQPQPIAQDLVFVGGGHSHAIALKQFGMHPIPGVRITLVTDVVHTPYSGMLPGYVAGLYQFDDCHIDLDRLAQFAQATLVVNRVVGLELQTQRLLFADRPPIAFDWLSIDIGSTPATLTIPGAADHAIPVKPISRFLATWDQWVEEVRRHPDRPLKLAIVGGGAGGVELGLSVQARLSRLRRSQPSPLEIHLLHRGDRLLPERHSGVGQRALQMLQQRGVQVHLGETVVGIEAAATKGAAFCQTSKRIHCQSGLSLTVDRVFWVVQAAAAPWVKRSGLAVDDQGFIQVNDALQSLSHPQVFAAGDIATLVNHPRPKAGVFAVRQGLPLYHNLRRALLHQPLRPFRPQTDYLILLGTGTQSAIASRGRLSFGPTPWLWRWKDAIDRRFMAKFSQDLRPSMDSPAAQSAAAVAAPIQPPCTGCAAKVSDSALSQALTRLKTDPLWRNRSDILIGLDAPDDAAVIEVVAPQVLVQTIDYFRALVKDPYVLSQICTQHSLNDVYAMGATPQSGLAIATLPYASEVKSAELLYQLLSGVIKVLAEADAVLMGGHTTSAAELSFGLVCNGLAEPHQLWRKGGMQPGQVLILTKPLGIGTLFAAQMQLQAKGRWIEAAIASMLQSNQAAVTCFRHHHATACTDISGFGLLGHLLEMVRASQVAVELDLAAIPYLEGAQATLGQGIFSSLHPQNLKAARAIAQWKRWQRSPHCSILFDPQTSGGLLAAVPADQAELCLAQLKELGYAQSRQVGRVLPTDQDKSMRLTINF